jgi:hypothetical protein
MCFSPSVWDRAKGYGSEDPSVLNFKVAIINMIFWATFLGRQVEGCAKEIGSHSRSIFN